MTDDDGVPRFPRRLSPDRPEWEAAMKAAREQGEYVGRLGAAGWMTPIIAETSFLCGVAWLLEQQEAEKKG